MTFQKFLVVLIALITSAPLCAQGKVDVYGRWKVTAVLDASPVAGMSTDEANRLVGKRLVLSPRAVMFDGRNCPTPPYHSAYVRTSDFFVQEYKLDPKTLALPDRVLRVDAGCTNLFIRNTDTIVFDWKGYFFEAVKDRKPLKTNGGSVCESNAPKTGKPASRPF